MSACVGRERELAWINARLESTSATGTGLVVVTGAAGIGKSRLLSELREQVRLAGFPVLEGWCIQHAAYAPFVTIASQALAWLRARNEQELLAPSDLESLAPLVLHRTPRSEPDFEDDDDANIRFVDSLGRLLAAVGRVRPVLILLRGYSRCDNATRTLIRALLDAAGPLGEPTPGAPSALIVTAVRSETPHELHDHPRASSLVLEGLDVEGVLKLIADASYVSRVHSMTGGNPDAVLGLIERPIPPREAEIASRLSHLGEVSQMLLAVLGAAGRPLPVEILARGADVDAQSAGRSLPALVDARLVWRDLDPSGVVIGLVRNDAGRFALDALHEQDRTALHQRLSEALYGWNRVPPEESLAHSLSGTDPSSGTLRVAEVAQSLMRRHAHSAALALVQRAALLTTGPALIEFAHIAAQAAKQMGGFNEARVIVQKALSLHPQALELFRLEAEIALALGDLDACASALGEAGSRVLPSQTELRGALAAIRAELNYQRGALDDAESAAREAISLLPEDKPLHTQARNAITKVFMWRGDLDQSWDWTQENITRARARGVTTEVLRGLINLGVIAVRRGDLEEASRQFEAARRIASRGGTIMLRGVLKENEAVVAHLRGHFGDALTLYQEALGILIRVGHRQFLARIANNLGELYVQVGETTRARRLCDYAAQVGRGLSRGVMAEGLLLRGQVELSDGRTDAARTALTEALSMFAAAGESVREAEAHLLLARAAVEDGDLVRARAEIATVPEDDQIVGTRVVAERALLLVDLARAEGRDTLVASRHAMTLAENAGGLDIAFQATVRLAHALIDQGDMVSARRSLATAESHRTRLLAPIPEALRLVYDATLLRTGLQLLTARVELTEAGAGTSLTSPQRTSRVGVAPAYEGLVGEATAMQLLRRMIARVAPTDTTVLLRGESGTGKERVAEAIHAASRRRSGPLVKVNCAALAEGVLLSELFGHEKGAFTMAHARRKGRFEAAEGGTIFLDEIGDISPGMQTALLRVLQERTFERVGGNTPLRADVRVIAATNRDLEAAMRTGQFREDLYYRLADITLRLPPLRERLEDLPLLANHLVELIAREHGLQVRRLSPAASRRLAEHPWPGNVRELGSALKGALLMADGVEIQPEDIELHSPARVSQEPRPSMLPEADSHDEVSVVYDRIRTAGVSLFDMRREIEKGCIAKALEESGHNITRAGALLGMKRPRMSQLVREYGLAKPSASSENDES